MGRTKTARGKMVESIKKSSQAKVSVEPESIATSTLIPSDSTLLNLACSGNPNGAFLLGGIENIVGDSTSGKTFLFLTMLAAVCQKSRFKDYILKHDDIEEGCQFDIPYLFGNKLAKRLEQGESNTIQDFQSTILNMIEKGDPFIYGLDSFDALTSDEELERLKKKAKGKATSGSYKTERTAGLSEMLRTIKKGLAATRSTVVIISQVRENLGAGMFDPKFRRAGGKALKHYSSHEIWLTRGRKIKVDEQTVGIISRPSISKNRLTGKERTVEFPILHDYGIDDIGSCVEFLTKKTGYWKKKGNSYVARGLGLTATCNKIIDAIEENGWEKELKRITAAAWQKQEDDIRIERKKRFK